MRVSSPSRAGFSLIDVCVSMALLAIALGILIGSSLSAMKLDQVNASTALASQALRGMCESMQAMPIDEVLDSYRIVEGEHESTRAPKLARLTVRDELLAGSDGALPVARAHFPLAEDGTLREDLELPELGLPRDLDGDGAIDSEDHTVDFRLLPVVLEAARERVRGLRWSFVLGDQDETIERAAVERDVARLQALGAEVEFHVFAGGHELEPGLLARL